jgi:hypothetical protein
VLKDRLIDPNFTQAGLVGDIRIHTNLTLLEAKYLATLIAGRYIKWMKDVEAVRGS